MKIYLAQSIFPLLAIACLLAGISPAIATVQFIPPPPPNQGYPPGSLRGGASRGDCPTVETQLTSLFPATIDSAGNGTPVESVWGLTTLSHPTFWFYVPYSLTDNRLGEFVLLDGDRNYVYQLSDIRSSEAGIIQIALPPSLPPLEIGKRYQWAFMIHCEVDNPIFTQGSIERIAAAAPLANQLARSTASERAVFFANHGIWFDALTTLAELHLANPNDRSIGASWHSLMQSVGLAEMADQPLLDCCTPDEVQ